MKRALFVSNNLIGDGLYISPSLNVWHKANPDYDITIQTLKNYVTPIYEHMGVPATVVTEAVDMDHEFKHVFNVSDAFHLSDQKKIHIAESYAELLGVQLEKKQDGSHLRPIYNPPEMEVPEEHKGVILVSMFSASCSSRQGGPPNKMLPWKTWVPILRYLRALDIPIRFLGGPDDRAPLEISEDEYLRAIPMPMLANVMRKARVLVTVDNGMSHMAASQLTPTFLFYPVALGTHFILPRGNRYMKYIHMNPVSLEPGLVLRHMKEWIPQMLEVTKENEPRHNVRV